MPLGNKLRVNMCGNILISFGVPSPLPALIIFLSVSGTIHLSSSESWRLALHTHEVPLPQVLHPLGVSARTLLASFSQRGSSCSSCGLWPCRAQHSLTTRSTHSPRRPALKQNQ
ncbi:hypothetical protein EYF80_005385 [Liparis tanakae]|uniref:Uncharacterized protein n=1 Tax=Liparis tanakae TaxID=230148 RepID=A0A4Z2J4J8_9TELE|nr:hypothetical protein EYF80_005385 [Liparis tanakae]